MLHTGSTVESRSLELTVSESPIFQTSLSFETIWFPDVVRKIAIPLYTLLEGGSFKLLKYFTYRFMLAVLATFIFVFCSLCHMLDQLLRYMLSRQEWPRTIPSTISTTKKRRLGLFYSLTTPCYVINDAVDEKPRSRGPSFCLLCTTQEWRKWRKKDPGNKASSRKRGWTKISVTSDVSILQ